MNTMKTKSLITHSTREDHNVINTVPVDVSLKILILKITKELNQQFNTYNLYGLSSFLNSLVARHHTFSSIVALSAAHQKQIKNRRLAHASTMLGVPLSCDQSLKDSCPLRGSHSKNVVLLTDSSASFFNIVEQQRLPEPGFSLRGEDKTISDSPVTAAPTTTEDAHIRNGQQTQVPFKLSRDYSFEEEGFED